jgi:hypothetical protein
MYIHVSRTPGLTTADYEKVVAELGPQPIAGKMQHYVGEVDGSLVVVDVWSSRTQADRFAAERLFPAFERVGIHPPADAMIFGYEAVTS